MEYDRSREPKSREMSIAEVCQIPRLPSIDVGSILSFSLRAIDSLMVSL
jgi:hypothetical protein